MSECQESGQEPASIFTYCDILLVIQETSRLTWASTTCNVCVCIRSLVQLWKIASLLHPVKPSEVVLKSPPLPKKKNPPYLLCRIISLTRLKTTSCPPGVPQSSWLNLQPITHPQISTAARLRPNERSPRLQPAHSAELPHGAAMITREAMSFSRRPTQPPSLWSAGITHAATLRACLPRSGP